MAQLADRVRKKLKTLVFRRVAQMAPQPDDGYFDVIVLSDVIEHIVNLWPAMEEITRLLKPNGHVVISTPNIASLRARVSLLMGVFPSSKPQEGFKLRVDAAPHDGGHDLYIKMDPILGRLRERVGRTR